MTEFLEHNAPIEKETELGLFLIFETQENMNTFLSEKVDLKKFEIKHQYNVIPVVYVKCKYQFLENLESNDLIHKIDIDYRCYLSSTSTRESITNNRDLKSVFMTKQNKGQGIRIALVDSGIDHKLKKIKKPIVSKVDTTSEPWDDLAGHGTLMASVIATIVPQAELVDGKIASRSGLVYASNVLSGLDQIFSMQIDILMLGVSSPAPTDGSDVLTTICKKYVEKGVLVVVPAGNFGPELNTIGFTSQIPDSFCIGSMNSNEKISFFSSRTSDKPDFYVTGENVSSTTSFHGSLGKPHPTNSEKRIISGTSVASAKFTGMLALIKQANPEYSFREMYHFILQLSSKSKYLSEEKVNEKLGFKRPNLSPFKRTLLISSLVTLTLGLFGIGSIFLFR